MSLVDAVECAVAAAGCAQAPAFATLDLATADDASLAARAAELVNALRGADIQAHCTATAEIRVWAAIERDDAQHPRAMVALLAADVLPALTQLLHPTAAALSMQVSLLALNVLMSSSRDARSALQPNMAVTAVVDMLRLMRDADRNIRTLAMCGVCSITNATQCADACCGITDFVPLLLEQIKAHSEDSVAAKLLLDAIADVTSRAAGRALLWVERCVPNLVALALKFSDLGDIQLCEAALQVFASLLSAWDADTVDLAHRAGVFQACAVFVSTSSALAATEYGRLRAPAAILITALAQPTSLGLAGCVRNLLIAQPGALAGLLLSIGSFLQEFLLRLHNDVALWFNLLRDDVVLVAMPECWLLDSHHAIYALLLLRKIPTLGDAGIDAIVQQWSGPQGLHALTQPLPHQRVPAAVSLALLSDEPQFRTLLAAGERLDTLIGALMQAVTGAAPEPQRCPLAWQTRAVRAALKTLVDTTGLAQHAAAAAHDAAGDDDAPPAKRQRIGGFTFSAADVNVQRRDSTVLLISGRPFYVYGPLVEAKSAVLADALRDVTTLNPVAVPLPHDVPDSMQYALFHAAMEHAYTGSIADVAAASLLPLWCIADCLQMDELRAWCVERMAPALAADVALLESAWATALARPSDALGDACAAAWLVRAAAEKEEGDNDALIQLLSRVHAACAAKELPAVQLVRVLRAALQQPAATAAAEGA